MMHVTDTRWLWLLPFLIAAVAGCDRSASSPKTTKPAATQIVMAECLPCRGHKIEVTATTPHTDYAGKTYYFCSDGCRETFLANPEKHVAKSPTTAPASQPIVDAVRK